MVSPGQMPLAAAQLPSCRERTTKLPELSLENTMPTPPELGAPGGTRPSEVLRGAAAALELAPSAEGRSGAAEGRPKAPLTNPNAAFKDETAAAMVRSSEDSLL